MIPDFVIKYNPNVDTQQDIARRIIYCSFVKPLLFKKPVVVFVGGDSGEGKSWAIIKLQEEIFTLLGLDPYMLIEHVNVHTPLQYPKKLKNLLYPREYTNDPDLCLQLEKACILGVHEARTLVKAKKWRDFVSQAVSDVNAMSRSIKRICFLIVSQFIRDITTDVRYTLNYYCKVFRPLGKPARLYIQRIWKDDRDLEHPVLKKRKVRGYIVYPNGRYKFFSPDYIELSKPDRGLTEIFDRNDFESKGKIIHNMLEKMIKEMHIEAGIGSGKIAAMVEWYSQNPEDLHRIGKVTAKGKWNLKPDVRKIHDLTTVEFKEFKEKLNENLNKLKLKEYDDNVDKNP